MSSISDPTSPSLLDRARAHDPEAWQKVVRIYGPLVYYWARQAGLQASDAADVGQDVFLAVSKSLAQFQHRPGERFRGWLWTITRNQIRKHFTKSQSQPVAEGGSTANLRLANLPLEPPSEESTDGKAELDQLKRRALLELRATFHETVWNAFWRTVVDERQPAEVASELGVSVWSVYKSRARVLQRLRVELEQLVEFQF